MAWDPRVAMVKYDARVAAERQKEAQDSKQKKQAAQSVLWQGYEIHVLTSGSSQPVLEELRMGEAFWERVDALFDKWNLKRKKG